MEDKIRVFISSMCGQEEHKKYDEVREKIKEGIEATDLGKVYVFEENDARSLTVQETFLSKLMECHVCIFLIDNKDGVSEGVKKEFKFVRKYNIKAIYFFCNQYSQEKTFIQKKLQMPNEPVYQIINKFENFEKAVLSFFNDVISVYKIYCKPIDFSDYDESKTEKTHEIIIQSIEIATKKGLFTSNFKTKYYFDKMFIGHEYDGFSKRNQDSNDYDKICIEILPLFFENNLINEKPFGDLKQIIEQEYSNKYCGIICNRIDALLYYLKGDFEKTINILKSALEKFKDNDKVEWIKNDILIDLRTLTNWYNEIENKGIYDLTYQNELDKRKFEFHYPIIDRFHADLYENIVKEDIKQTIESPNAITYGSNLNQYTNLLAKSFMISLFNGSIIHLNLTYSHIKNIAFAMLKKYDSFNLKMIVLKSSIIHYQKNEIANIVRYFPELSYALDSKDVVDLYYFMDNNPTTHIRINAKLEVFKIYAYFLDDNDFDKIWRDLHKLINEVFENKIALHYILSHIIETLRASFARISFNTIMDWVEIYFENNYSIAYDEIFKMFSLNLNVEKLEENQYKNFVNFISTLIVNNKINSNYKFKELLINLCNDGEILINEIENLIITNMNDFYIKEYKEKVISKTNKENLLENQIKIIHENNVKQGLNGNFFEDWINSFELILYYLSNDYIVINDNMITHLLDCSIKTAFNINHTIKTKTQAICLIICLCGKFENKVDKKALIKKFDDEEEQKSLFNTCSLINHYDEVTLEFSVALLNFVLGIGNELEIIEKITDINSDANSIKSITVGIIEYLQYCQDDDNIIPIILQNAVMWSKDDTKEICTDGTRLLLLLLKFKNYSKLIKSQIDRLMNGNMSNVKLLILRNIMYLKNTNLAFYNEILEIASKDKNYIIRIIAEELK